MSVTETTEGFWPNIASAPVERGALGPAGVIALAPAPEATELSSIDAAILEAEAASHDGAVEASSVEASPAEAEPAAETPIEAPVEAAPESAIEEPAAEESAPEDPAVEETAVAERAIELAAVEPCPADEPVAEPTATSTFEDELAADQAAERALAEELRAADEAEAALAAELGPEQIEDFADVIDIGGFGSSFDEVDTDLFHDGITAAELAHLPVTDGSTLGGGNLAAVRAVNPRGLAAHQELEASVMAATETLSTADRTLIGLIVSVENDCGYWQVHLGRRLERWFDEATVAAMAADWTHADLPIRERAMLAFTVKLTLIPGQMTEDDANLLVSVGFSERDLLDIVDVVAYWSFATRVVDGLGVFLEPWLADRQAAVTD